MSHMARIAVDSEHRVVIYSHPTNTLAMNYVHPFDVNYRKDYLNL